MVDKSSAFSLKLVVDLLSLKTTGVHDIFWLFWKDFSIDKYALGLVDEPMNFFDK